MMRYEHITLATSSLINLIQDYSPAWSKHKEKILEKSKTKNVNGYVYVAITGNNRLVKIGWTRNPEKRLGYSLSYFHLKSLRYVALFPGNEYLERVLLRCFTDLRAKRVNGKQAIEWFYNKESVNTFVKEITEKVKEA